MKTTVPPLGSIDRLLIVKTSSIGDVLHALPLAQALKDTRPSLTLGWVVRARCADILRGNPHIDHLYVVPDKPALRDLLALRRTLHRARYSVALDLQGLLLPGLLTWLSGAPVRVGWDRNREGNALFLTHPIVPGKNISRHEIDALFGFADALGIHPAHESYPPQMYLAAQDRAWADQHLAGLPHPLVALNVGASRAYKRWPPEHWAALADGLSQRGAGLVFVGDKSDAALAAQVRALMTSRGPAIDLAGQTSLRALASVLAACDLAVSADTGPMHLAVAVGTPTVALFGGTDPRRHGPYGALHTALHRPLPGETPSRRPSDAYGEACMRALSPDDVLHAIPLAKASHA